MHNRPSNGTRSNREIGKERFDRLAVEVSLIKYLDGSIDKGPTILSRDNYGTFDLPSFNKASRKNQGIDKSQAGIGNIEDLDIRTEPH